MQVEVGKCLDGVRERPEVRRESAEVLPLRRCSMRPRACGLLASARAILQDAGLGFPCEGEEAELDLVFSPIPVVGCQKLFLCVYHFGKTKCIGWWGF